MGEALAEELQTEVAFTIPLFGGIPVHESIVVMWGIMAFIMIVVLLLTQSENCSRPWAGDARICGNVGEQFLGRQHGQSR